MSAPKRYPAPLGDTPHPLMSRKDRHRREGTDVSVVLECEKARSHHRGPTRGGRTSGRHGGLLVSCLSRESEWCIHVSTRCRHTKWGDALGQWPVSSDLDRHEHKTPVRPQSRPGLDNRRSRNTTSKRLKWNIFFDTRRRSRRLE